MRRVLLAVLLSFALLFGVWAARQIGHTSQQEATAGTISNDNQVASGVHVTQLDGGSGDRADATQGARDASSGAHLTSTLPPDQSAVSPSARYGRRMGGRFDKEAVDPDWAPQMAATIDSVLRSMGGYVRDARVDCFTTGCRAVAYYRPSFYLLDETVRAREATSLMTTFESAMAPLIEASPRLDGITGLGVAMISPEWPDENNLHETLGAVFFIKGPVQSDVPK